MSRSSKWRGGPSAEDWKRTYPFANRPLTREEMRSNYTERARGAFARSREEAQRLGHSKIRCLHIMVALLREGEGIGCIVLNRLGVDIDRLREWLELHAGPAESQVVGASPGGHEDEVEVLDESAIDVAMALNHQYIGSEHVLLALTRVTSGPLGVAFAQAGVSYESALQELKRLYKQ